MERFLPRIAALARAYRAGGVLQRDELLQEGVLGLLRALERYDPDRGVPFLAYATWWVRQAMQQLASELTRPLVLSDRALRHLARLKEAHAAALRETGREPGRDALAARAELTAAQVDDLLATLSEREREILRAHHGTDGPAESLRDIGARLGLSAERVRQLEQRALAKLAAAADG